MAEINVVVNTSQAVSSTAELEQAFNELQQAQDEGTSEQEKKWAAEREQAQKKKAWVQQQEQNERRLAELSQQVAQQANTATTQQTGLFKKLNDHIKNVHGSWTEMTAKFDAISGVIGGAKNMIMSAAASVKEWVKEFEVLNNQMTILKSQKGGLDIVMQMEKLDEATNGVIGKFDLLESVNKATSFGIDLTKGRLEKLVNVSNKAASTMGVDLKFAFDSLIVGTARESKLILDNLGVIVDVTSANETYAKSLGKTKEELTDVESKTALLNQVLERLDRTQKNINDDTLVTAGTGLFNTIERNIKAVKLSIGEAFSDFFNGIDELGMSTEALHKKRLAEMELASKEYYERKLNDTMNAIDTEAKKTLEKHKYDWSEEQKEYFNHLMKKRAIEEQVKNDNMKLEEQYGDNVIKARKYLLDSLSIIGKENSQMTALGRWLIEKNMGEKMRKLYGDQAWDRVLAEAQAGELVKNKNSEQVGEMLASARMKFNVWIGEINKDLLDAVGSKSGQSAFSKLFNKEGMAEIKKAKKELAEYNKEIGKNEVELATINANKIEDVYKKEVKLSQIKLREISINANNYFQTTEDSERIRNAKMQNFNIQKLKAQQELNEKLNKLDEERNKWRDKNNEDILSTIEKQDKEESKLKQKDQKEWIKSAEEDEKEWTQSLLKQKKEHDKVFKDEGKKSDKKDKKDEKNAEIIEEYDFQKDRANLAKQGIQEVANFSATMYNDVLFGQKEFHKEMLGDFLKSIGTQLVSKGIFNVLEGTIGMALNVPGASVQATMGAVEIASGTAMGAAAKAIGTSGNGSSESKSKETASSDRINNNNRNKEQMQLYLYPTEKVWLRSLNRSNKKLGYK